MSDIVLAIEKLSKRYLVGHQSAQRERYTALRDVISREAQNFARKAADFVRGRQIVQGDEIEEFWALRDVSFRVKRGEVLGIIGRNGAGKSTLLKVLSRVTEPTEGRILLQGRVSSLLEVGTGFHPELTGRENIFLNGAILGMTQREIRMKFDEIVAFAEVEKFLDTPVKRYSSGMYVRLAFAVAAHLEPEILLVDEVLAVGDAAFQAKCLGKMKDVTTQGRTVLFVSHNMNAMKQLTDRLVLLREGVVDYIGPAGEAIERYLGCTHRGGQRQFEVANAKRQYPGTGDARILALRFDRALPHFNSGEPIRYVVSLRAERPIRRLRVGMTIHARDGTPVGSAFSPEIEGIDQGAEREVVVTLPFDRLAPGAYHCGVSIGSGNNQSTFVDYDIVLDTLFFEVAPQSTLNGTMAFWETTWGSILLPELAIEPFSQPEPRGRDKAKQSFAEFAGDRNGEA
jgi:lipopolysaccharide transport system ATP-binding protein